jgi:hypothetical protein
MDLAVWQHNLLSKFGPGQMRCIVAVLCSWCVQHVFVTAYGPYMHVSCKSRQVADTVHTHLGCNTP